MCMQRSTVSGSALVIDIDDREELYYKPVIALHNSGNNQHYRPWESLHGYPRTVSGGALDHCSGNPTFPWSVMSAIALA